MARLVTYNEAGVLTFDSAYRQLVVLGSGSATLSIVAMNRYRNPLYWTSGVVPMSPGSVLRAFQGPYPAVGVQDVNGNAYIRGCSNDPTQKRISVSYFDLGPPSVMVAGGAGLVMYTPSGELACSSAQPAAKLVRPGAVVAGRSYAAIPVNSRLNITVYGVGSISPMWTGCSAASMNGTTLVTRAPRGGQSGEYPWGNTAGLAFNYTPYVGTHNGEWVGPSVDPLIFDVTDAFA